MSKFLIMRLIASPVCQTGVRSQFRKLGGVYPTLPKRYPILAQKPTGTGRVHCTCIVQRLADRRAKRPNESGAGHRTHRNWTRKSIA